MVDLKKYILFAFLPLFFFVPHRGWSDTGNTPLIYEEMMSVQRLAMDIEHNPLALRDAKHSSITQWQAACLAFKESCETLCDDTRCVEDRCHVQKVHTLHLCQRALEVCGQFSPTTGDSTLECEGHLETPLPSCHQKPWSKLEEILGLYCTEYGFAYVPNEESLMALRKHTESTRLEALLTATQLLSTSPIGKQASVHWSEQKDKTYQMALEPLNERYKLIIQRLHTLPMARIYLETDNLLSLKQAMALHNNLEHLPYQLQVHCQACADITYADQSSHYLCGHITINAESLSTSEAETVTTYAFIGESKLQSREVECKLSVVAKDRMNALEAQAFMDIYFQMAIKSAEQNDIEEAMQSAVYGLRQGLALKAADDAWEGPSESTLCYIQELIALLMTKQQVNNAWFVEYFAQELTNGQSFMKRRSLLGSCAQKDAYALFNDITTWLQGVYDKKRQKHLDREAANLVKRYKKGRKWIPQLFVSFLARSEDRRSLSASLTKQLVHSISFYRNPQYFGWHASLELLADSEFSLDWNVLLRAYLNRSTSSAFLWAVQVAAHLCAETSAQVVDHLLGVPTSLAPLPASLFAYAYLPSLAERLNADQYAELLPFVRMQTHAFLDSFSQKELARISVRAQVQAKQYEELRTELFAMLYGAQRLDWSPEEFAKWSAALLVVELELHLAIAAHADVVSYHGNSLAEYESHKGLHALYERVLEGSAQREAFLQAL